MHAHLTPVSSSSDSTGSTHPIHPSLQPPQTPTSTSSPVATYASAGRSPFSTTPAVETASFDVVPDRRGTASLKWDFAAERGRPEDVLPLWVADMDHATAPTVTNALLWRTRHGIFGYSEPDDAYNAALTGWFSRRYGWRVEAEWNTVTPGVVPALALAVRALTAPGKAVLIEEPVYYPFREVVEDNGRTVAAVPLVRDADGVYRRDLAALEATIEATGSRLLLLCNPHNPVGRVWSRDELAALDEVAARHGVVVVADEIHADLALPGFTTTPFASLGEATAARTITCTSPSKSFNLAGLQVANILITDAHLREAFRRELATTGYSQPNVLGLTACRAAYEGGDAWLDALREHIAAARAHVEARLERIEGIEAAPCEGTYLLWLDCSGLLQAAGLTPDELDDVMLHEAGLWLDDGRIFGAGGEGFTRINVACPRVTLDAALDRLEA
ncbi:MalY/PatB family protein, partial [uncultured Actinomyces sp.]|uniref:MalY/PatB family protein n=1 Tax=uncultured Actinomyces sp. TaxID=249061 RepID=UPI0028D543E2